MLKRLNEWLGRESRSSLNDQIDYFRGKAYEFEDRLAKAVERTDGLTSLNKMLNRDLQEACDNREVERYANTQSVGMLEREIDRLQAILMDQVENAAIHGVTIKDGSIELAVLPPHWAIKAMAGSFLETLDNAPNWRAIEIGPIPSDGGMLIATVCRASGESPVETVGKLRAMITELLHLDCLADADPPSHGDVFTMQKAFALINPEKKD